MKFNLDAFYLVCPQSYDADRRDLRKFHMRYPRRDNEMENILFYTSWGTVPASDNPRDRVKVIMIHRGGAAHESVSTEESSTVKKKKSKQDRLIEEHLAKERQKIRDYADELPALLSYARALLLREELKRKEKAISMKKNDKYQFEIGDQVWFSMPLRTDKQGREDSQIKKFQFRWSGPMRVIARSEDFNRYTVVEVLPDGRLLSRQANAARLRPYNNIPPNDTADKAAKGVIDDDFAQEIELWKKFAVLQRRPKMKVAEGFYVEKLEDHALEDGEYEYKVKCRYREDYWNDVAKKNVKEYFKRLAHVEKHGIPKRAKPVTRYTDAADNVGFPDVVDDLNDEDITHNDDSYDDVNPVKLVTRPVMENKKRAKDDDIPLALEDFVFTTLY
ncbi:hypothetical protein BC829DRAFT_423551 [Chytridium lagenaria]|nr:hypothetical protein BC829DRAFT_423551 [Chytridium lagenaria]